MRYEPDFSRQSDPQGYERFLKRHREQVAELLTKYGEIDVLEFDCEPRQTNPAFRKRQIEDWTRFWPDIKENIKYARQLSPDVLFRERGIGSYGDFHTPEGRVPASTNAHRGDESPHVKVWQTE